MMAVVGEHRRRPFHVLHAVWANEPGYLAVKAGRLLGIPSVVSLFGGELVSLRDIRYGCQLSRMSRYLIRLALRRATVVTAGSTYLQRMARPYLLGDNLLPIAIGVNTDLFCARSEVPPVDLVGEKKLLHVASLVPVKDQATLLCSMAHVVRHVPAAYLHLVGDGPLRNSLTRLASSLNLADRVIFHGEVSHERLPAYYRCADLCVLSSRHEGQEMVSLEAAACLRPNECWHRGRAAARPGTCGSNGACQGFVSDMYSRTISQRIDHKSWRFREKPKRILAVRVNNFETLW